MEDRIALYAIPNIADAWSDEPLDLSLLPATIVPGVTIEDTSSYIDADTFDGVERELGRHKMSAMRSMRYAIVHRYQPKQVDLGGEADRKAEALVRSLAACLTLIRPATHFTRKRVTVRVPRVKSSHSEYHPKCKNYD